MKRPGLALFLLAFGSIWLADCTHRRTFSTEMEWYNDKGLRRDVLMGQTRDVVCLKYVNAPHFYECLFAPRIKERLHAFERENVRVDFEVTCKAEQVVSYRVAAVDGRGVGIVQNAISGKMGNRNEYPLFDACL